MSWGTKRRNLILFTLFLFIFIPVSFIAFLIFYNPPSCFDLKQNGDEQGIDCGGSCQLVCTNQAFDPVVLWERYFRIDDGIYNVLAYIENPNPTAEIVQAEYVFKLFNEENVLIAEKPGTITFAPKSVRPIIETGLITEKQVPTRVSFEFTKPFTFEKKDPKDAIVIIKEETIENEKTSPRVKAAIQNISLQRLRNIEVVVIIYDSFDNVLGTSSTFVPDLGPEESKDIVFTWPQPFIEDSLRIEVIPIYDFN
jgi:hypothetical protein